MNPDLSSLRFKHLFLVCISIVLSACQTTSTKENWPEDLPDRALFVSAYNKQVKEGANNEPLDSHLKWVVRFYQGSVFYAVGWNDMIELVVNSFEDPANKALSKKRLTDLGFKICVEWAQSNEERNIDSANIAVWGDSLRTSVERQEQFSYIDKVDEDVDNLIAGKLNPMLIKRERYYPPEDYDNF